MGIRDRVAALLGVSAYTKPIDPALPTLEDAYVQKLREQYGGRIQLPSQTRTRWYLKDVETAERLADQGDLRMAGQLMQAAKRDGVYSGVMSTRTSGLVRLPKRFRGSEKIVAELERGTEETRSVFDEMCPAAEIALLARDGEELGVGVAELVEVEGREHPILIRKSPEFLYYRWSQNQWYFKSIAGLIPIVPGDGRWVLHIPGGRLSPWQNGIWKSIARAHIRKEHAKLHRDNWEAKLANPARVAVSPQGAGETQKQDWFRQVMAWGINTVFGVTPGYDVKLLESNGRGHESFSETIKEQNEEMIIAVAGQLITTQGGTGFDNQDIHQAVRADLIKATEESLSQTINTQVLPPWIAKVFGEEELDAGGAAVSWDITPPKDKNSEASAAQTAATAITSLTKALAEHGMKLDAREIAIRFGIPFVESPKDQTAYLPEVSLPGALELAQGRGLQPDKDSIVRIVNRLGISLEDIPEGDSAPRKIDLAPTDVAKVVKVVEARSANGLPPFGDERDDLTIAEFAERSKANAEAAGDIQTEIAKDDLEDEDEGDAESVAEGVA